MEKLITRKEAAEILGISIATLDAARNNDTIDSGRLAEFIRDSLVELSHHEHAKGRECLEADDCQMRIVQ
ncbi:hypothetical protein NE473_31135, partial [Hungatella sp. SL.1.14]|nr:hypothetical protein [Hungatella sp. SL.1.14]